MCGRYVLVQKIETIEKRFNVKSTEGLEWKPSYNTSIGQLAPVITSDHPQHLDLMRFGLTPFWSKKQMYLFNARSEGDRNMNNDPNYSGSKNIINKPAFRKLIRSQRCLVLADAFIEGSNDEGLKKPFLVYLQNKERPFAMAGVFDEWKDMERGETLRSFSIITTTSNSLMQQFPHSRMPVILEKSQEQRWLNMHTPLSEITKMLRPFNADLMNAYPISPDIKSPKSNGKQLITPIGERLNPEFNLRSSGKIHLQGMGRYKLD